MPKIPARLKLNVSAGLASVTTATVLVLLKFWALWETGALAIAASLADSAMDLLVSFAGLAAIVYAARPADEDHTFGHDAVEDLASLGQSIFIFGSGCTILWAAVTRLLSPAPAPIESSGFGVVVMALSAVITLGLITWQDRVSKSTNNKVVAADKLHYIGDLIPTLGAIAALVLAGPLGWTRVDSVFAIGAALFMLWGAIKIGREGWHALMNRAAPEDIIEGIEAIARKTEGIRSFHDLRTRTAGAKIFVQIHIELDGDQPLRQAHGIAAELKARIIRAYPDADVIVHMDVWHG